MTEQRKSTEPTDGHTFTCESQFLGSREKSKNMLPPDVPPGQHPVLILVV